jgi:hypothetical protein
MDNQDQSKNQEKSSPEDKDNDHYSQNLPTLSDLLVGFQKSMARVAQDTARATKEDPLFLYGRRNLYYIDQLDVDTVVRITPDIDPEKEAAPNFEVIRIFTADEKAGTSGEYDAGMTRIRFKLVGQSLDKILDHPFIFLRLNDTPRKPDTYAIELQVMSRDGSPTACREITVEILPDADERKKRILRHLETNELGILKLELMIKRPTKPRTRYFAVLTDGKSDSPQITRSKLYLIRAKAAGRDMIPPQEEFEEVVNYAPLIINHSY